MYRLRGLRSKFSMIRMAVFSRNVFPTVRVGEGRQAISFIKPEEDFERLYSSLERSATAMRNDVFVERRTSGTSEDRRVSDLVENARQRTTEGVASAEFW